MAGPDKAPFKRKLIEFDAETWNALDLLARDSRKSMQEMADEAFADLLKKHHRPVGLKQALRESARRSPANDPGRPPAAASAPERRRRSKRKRS